MAKSKKTSKESKPYASKITMNPPVEGGRDLQTKVPSGAPPEGIPSGLTSEQPPGKKIGQFTGRGSPGLQKK